MQQRFNNLSSKKAVRLLSLFCSLFFINQSTLGNESDSEGPDSGTQNAIMQLSTVKGAVGAIDRLNQAMETAAKNPNDEWRREEVRKAMREVPTAVQALAGTFSAHTMASSSLPFVLSTLGASVDVNAPNSFDYKLKDPSADPIPQGRKDLLKSNDSKEEVSLVLKEASLAESSTAYKGPLNSGSAPISSVVNKADTAILDFSLKSSLNNSTDNPSRTPASYSDPETSKSSVGLDVSQSVQLKTENKTPLVNTVESDISQVEKTLTELEASKKEEDDFFDTKQKSKKAEKESKRKLGPVSLMESTLIFLAERVISQEAFAEAVGGGAVGGGDGPQNGGGSPTNPQDGNGGGAAQFLFGAAAIMSAVAPMIVANTEAQKEQNIAQIETQAQIKQAEIQTETQRELAQLSAQTALSQAEAQKDIAVINNNAQSERLQLNLVAAQQQSNDARQDQAQQLALQQQLEAQKLALAQAQADQTLQLARQNLEGQRLQATLNDTGVAPSNLPPGGFAPSGASLNLGLNGGGNPLASALVAQATGTNPAAITSGFAGISGVNPVNAGSVSNARGIRRSVAEAPESLLAAAVAPEEEFSFIPRRNRVGSRGQRRSRGPLTTSRGIYRNGLSLTAAGSFREQRRALRGRDLSQFTQVNPLEEGFENNSKLPGRAISSTH